MFESSTQMERICENRKKRDLAIWNICLLNICKFHNYIFNSLRIFFFKKIIENYSYIQILSVKILLQKSVEFAFMKTKKWAFEIVEAYHKYWHKTNVMTYMRLSSCVQYIEIHHLIIHDCVECINLLQTGIVLSDKTASYKSNHHSWKHMKNSEYRFSRKKINKKYDKVKKRHIEKIGILDN